VLAVNELPDVRDHRAIRRNTDIARTLESVVVIRLESSRCCEDRCGCGHRNPHQYRDEPLLGHGTSPRVASTQKKRRFSHPDNVEGLSQARVHDGDLRPVDVSITFRRDLIDRPLGVHVRRIQVSTAGTGRS
jgi:hypothetical protein